MAPLPSEIRNKMKTFWEQYDPTPKSMMLCSDANNSLEEEDRKQVLNTCPPLHGKNVLELGAGIGRFTSELAKVCSSVTAVDFIESYIEKNRANNGHHEHVKFLAADVTEMELPENSFDVIFSNWLLMYLSNEELPKLMVKMLKLVKDGGYLFIRESCYRPSGDIKRESNPTYYRTPTEYFQLLQQFIYKMGSGSAYSFVCHKAVSMEPYIRHYGNPFQLGFVLQKMKADSFDSFQAFLDGHQYTEEGIRRYEFIFGKTYVSTGGHATTSEFVDQLGLKENDSVLDVGCGIGGSAFQMARSANAIVHGVDLSSNMIGIAVKYQAEMEDAVRKKVSFEMSDITKADFGNNKFDVVYSRDTILHIGEKENLFAKFFSWLKPGGKLMITDYCHGAKEQHSEDYLKYVLQRGYHMLTVKDYGHLLEKVGFEKVVAEDQTSTFIDILDVEVTRFKEHKKEFLTRFTEEDFKYIEDGWNSKLTRCRNGDQAWGFFTAVKPQ